MAKEGEIAYLRLLGEAGVRHAANKPFSDQNCHAYLMELGAIMALLPPPPASLLDIGCGTGWTSAFFARRGYDVVGVDIADDMIAQANLNKQRQQLANLHFRVADYEDLAFSEEFDCAVFYDSLHHAVDEQAAICMAYRSLRPGGVCITSEPGRGHHKKSVALGCIENFNVTEKDMPLRKIFALGKRAGFTQFRAFPHAIDLGQKIYGGRGARKASLLGSIGRALRWYLISNSGIGLMVK
jgi:SAM-dependent methyltransferase